MDELYQLFVTCLECGEQWYYAIPGTLAACLSLLTKRKLPADKCPACGAQQAIFSRRHNHRGPKTS
jgi:DNA-directed RNA polymerase subunit M/transcription elongation factor TFIIS